MQFYNLKKGFGIYLSLIFMLVFSACAGGQDFSRYDLSTYAGVNEAREAMAGKNLSNYGKGCIKRPAELPEIILVGTFAHDRGCMLEGAFVKKYFHSAREKDFSRAALKSLGWQKADSRKREELALKWTQFGLLAFGGYPIIEADEDFKGREFGAPEAMAGEAGVVQVMLWTRSPMGMRCETNYQRLLLTFSRDGDLLERKAIDSFTLPCKRN